MEVLEISGKRYLKASAIAKKLGYTADYVGQLCRQGKVDAKRIGRSWYVLEDSMRHHKREHIRSNKEKTLEAVEHTVSLTVGKEGGSRLAQSTPMHSIGGGYRKQVLETEISYSQDEHPLFPKVDQRKLPIQEESEAWSATLDLASGEEEALDIDSREPKFSGEVPVFAADEASVEEESAPIEMAPEIVEKPLNFKDRLAHKGISFLPEELPVEVKIKTNKSMPPARRPVMALVSVLSLLVGFVFIATNVFLQSVWVYDHGSLSQSFQFKTTVDMAAVSVPFAMLSR